MGEGPVCAEKAAERIADYTGQDPEEILDAASDEADEIMRGYAAVKLPALAEALLERRALCREEVEAVLELAK